MNPAGIFRFVSAEPSSAGNAPLKLDDATVPENVVAVIIPAPASIPDELIVTAVPTIALLVVVTPVTTTPLDNPTEPSSPLFTISSTCNL